MSSREASDEDSSVDDMDFEVESLDDSHGNHSPPHPVYSHEAYSVRPEDSKRNLIVNYLPQSFTDKGLFDLFIPFGVVHSVKIMRDSKSGYSYGYGFVNYFCEDDAAAAIQFMNGKSIMTKRLKVSVARPPSDDIKDTNLYICNLPQDIDENELERLFEPFGEIVQRNLLRDKLTNLPRGSAFVRYDKREHAQAAIVAMNNCVLKDCADPIRVKLAQDHGKQKAAYLAGFHDALRKRNSSSVGDENTSI